MYDLKTCKVVDKVLMILEEYDRIIIAIVDVHLENRRYKFVHTLQNNHQSYNKINE
jgi:hypothetical protein